MSADGIAAKPETVTGSGGVPPRDRFADEAAREVVRAEGRLASGSADPIAWSRYLDETRRRDFLLALPDDAFRARWAETAFGAIRASSYSFESLFSQRVAAHPERILFQVGPGARADRWSYARVWQRIRLIGAAFLSVSARPRVALLVENGLDGACCDLACLVNDVFVAPVAPHLGPEMLARIFDDAAIDLVVTDSEERLSRLASVRTRTKGPFRVFLTDGAAELAREDAPALGAACASQRPGEVDRLLSGRTRFALDDIATALFTSGSTGEEKGVAFTPFNLLSKRFARAAALPFVGEDEVLLCYLPLYHTFGRFLEMLGALFWGGTYVFAGNPSFETLAAGLKEVRPTGLVGIPVRWRQLRDQCLAVLPAPGQEDAAAEAGAVRGILGGRLAWGLSAAGHLEPSVFRFFQRQGIKLCSGFGMTEATGGVTMTPPGDYEDDSVGVPLPGMKVRFGPEGELQIAGPYLARYLDEPPGSGPPEERWLGTGDVFRRRANGHLEIVDRLKDIYKNSRGRTVAPRRVEQKFEGVPGILRTFLVGDGRDHNVLLVVLDPSDPVYGGDPLGEPGLEYLRRLVAAANEDLAPWERVVSFAVLPRDFEAGRELTPKGSFRRKAIEESFRDVIEGLYRGTAVKLESEGLAVQVPRWLFRDLGILEGDIALTPTGLLDRRRGRELPLHRLPSGAIRVGDLGYTVAGSTVDLGLFAHQPALWIGNPALVAFCPVKEGWDLPLGNVAPRVTVAEPGRDSGPAESDEKIPSAAVASLHRIAARALYGRGEDALRAVAELAERLVFSDARTGAVIRRRFEALSRHPELRVRCVAYEALLLDEGAEDTSDLFPAFLQAGLPFLDRESIEAIARADVEREHLLALRRRLHAYRTSLAWPAGEATRAQLAGVLELLTNFARNHRDYAGTVRSELAAWALHGEDPPLSRRAGELLDQLTAWFRESLEASRPALLREEWRALLAFHDGLPKTEIALLEGILAGTTFLEESVFFAFDGELLDTRRIPPSGIWVAPVLAVQSHRLYRIGVDVDDGRHFDLLLIVRDDLDAAAVRLTNLWMLAVGGFPGHAPVVPALGASRPEIGALSVAWVDELTVAERLRDCLRGAGSEALSGLRARFIRGLAATFSAWRASGRRIVPGGVSPANAVVPRDDYRDGAGVVSLAGWRPFTGPLSLVGPMLRNFFHEVQGLYPRCRGALDPVWIFEACVEGLGIDEARTFLGGLRDELARGGDLPVPRAFKDELERFLAGLAERFHAPLGLDLAVERYGEWEARRLDASTSDRHDVLRQLLRLYRLDRGGDAVRYHLYRRTIFAWSGEKVLSAFDGLLAAMRGKPHERPARMVELFDLQTALSTDEERLVFSGMVFPAAPPGRRYRVRTSEEGRHVLVTSSLKDRSGTAWEVRESIEPVEIGQLYRLFVRSGIPHPFAERRRHLIVLDAQERVVAGISYSLAEGDAARLDGIVVAAPLRGRGLSSAMLDDFCARMSGLGVRVVTTHIAFRDAHLGAGFHRDRRWGGLVRYVEASPEAEL